ncbi:MAG: nuclear transport factor 2 family protein [Hyphomonadaceae bacterium]|nr:nuclear transport factor 2 family protein [Hyphomonadaceae bacterium]
MQCKSLIIACAIGILLPACTVNGHMDWDLGGAEATSPEVQLLTILEDQQAAWNTGDIDGFMSAYWQSPDLRFASGGTVTSGWQSTRDRYHERYSNRALMGQLSFDALEFDLLGDDAAIVHGRWALTREADRPSGLFTLLFKQIDGEWKIVSDTTTSAD